MSKNKTGTPGVLRHKRAIKGFTQKQRRVVSDTEKQKARIEQRIKLLPLLCEVEVSACRRRGAEKIRKTHPAHRRTESGMMLFIHLHYSHTGRTE
jgi:hypothetical protein